MTISETTQPSLLIRIREPNDSESWAQFMEIYQPIIERFAQSKGLQDADAEDVAQEVFRKVAQAISEFEYHPKRGKFRSWLFTITHNHIRNYQQRIRPGDRGSGDTPVQDLITQQAHTDDIEQWEHDYQRHLFSYAAEQVKPDFQEKTWKAFWKTAVDNRPAAQVARELSMPLGTVYIAKSRVIA